MTLREFAKGYDGNIMLKAFENEKSTAPAANYDDSDYGFYQG